eukprot:7133119-Pyramimonas_sp.AAC.1
MSHHYPNPAAEAANTAPGEPTDGSSGLHDAQDGLQDGQGGPRRAQMASGCLENDPRCTQDGQR